jgi:hypothetical protein
MTHGPRGLLRHLLAAAVCAALGMLAFAGDGSVPLVRYVDLGVHEAGHALAFRLPDLANAMAGSIAQVALPLVFAGYFALMRRDVIGASLCLAWAGTSAANVSVYIADAPTQALPLVGGGTHDWAFALGPDGFDAMGSAARIASAVHDIGLAMVVIAILACLAVPALGLWRSMAEPSEA